MKHLIAIFAAVFMLGALSIDKASAQQSDSVKSVEVNSELRYFLASADYARLLETARKQLKKGQILALGEIKTEEHSYGLDLSVNGVGNGMANLGKSKYTHIQIEVKAVTPGNPAGGVDTEETLAHIHGQVNHLELRTRFIEYPAIIWVNNK